MRYEAEDTYDTVGSGTSNKFHICMNLVVKIEVEWLW